MKVPVLVPYRPDGGHRDRLWKWLQDVYWLPYPLCTEYTVVEGTSYPPEEPFNRSAAINRAARLADLDADEGTLWDVAVIADADTWVPRRQLDEAVTLARRTGRLVSALTSVIELNEACTETLLKWGEDAPLLDLGIERVRTDDFATQSSMLVVPRTLWERIGGFDEGFVGWGAEDNAFWKAAEILGGTPLRIEGAALHLWHAATDPIARLQDPQWRANWARWQRYNDAVCECTLRRAQRS
ncbi:glycosyltransferase [Mycobacterium phage Phrappuccino]|uniref:Glycosyltransferase n=1 Tax=Mycobacterium phage Phrappuccino TaxID=2591223 RepID=A0A514DDX7_9CAUD|nr:galactosyl transferase [Mycobacterium phage Phrappuccino]QDH91819.1 glycosyltransferase [Mycobacterium phage Phrappuccino]QIQ63261.1 glycosyltransferase [Mycobacterium phage Settecandela]